jgi:hypothetical protein
MATKRQQDEENDTDTGTTAKEHTEKRSFDEIIEHFKEEGRRREVVTTQWLYKYDHEKNGTERIQIGKFQNEDIKDQHEIGLIFGAGRYGVLLYNAKGKADSEERKAYLFRLGDIYNTYKAEADAEKRKKELEKFNGQPAGAAAIQPAGGGTAESFLMVKEILSMILPVLQQANRAAAIPAAGPRQESPAEMINSYSMMQKLLKTNLFDTAETLREYSRRYAGPAQEADFDEADAEPEEKEKNLMEKIIEMIEPFFGLIASKSPAASIAAQGLRAAPQFVEILNDPQLCRMIIQHFDRTKGRAASDIALNNIGINRAELFQIPQQQQQRPGGAAPRQSQPTPPPAILRPANGKRNATKPQQAAATTAKT